MQHYGELPRTANNHLGIKKTSCDSELSLSLKTSKKDKLVKGYGAQKIQHPKAISKWIVLLKDEIHKSENKSVSQGFYKNNIKYFSQDIFNDEHHKKSGESQELSPKQPFSPHLSLNGLSLTGTKISKETGHLEKYGVSERMVKTAR